MITAEDSREYKFFTCDGKDMWLLESVTTAHVAHLRRIDKRVSEGPLALATVVVGAPDVRFVPVTLPVASRLRDLSDEPKPSTSFFDGEIVTIEYADNVPLASDEGSGKPGLTSEQSPPAKEPVARQASPVNRRPPGRKSSTGYKGVYRHKTKSGIRYKAAVSIGGKLTHLGTYTDRHLAAAAVADHNGDKEEAIRLRELSLENAKAALTVGIAEPLPDPGKKRVFAASNDRALV